MNCAVGSTRSNGWRRPIRRDRALATHRVLSSSPTRRLEAVVSTVAEPLPAQGYTAAVRLCATEPRPCSDLKGPTEGFTS